MRLLRLLSIFILTTTTAFSAGFHEVSFESNSVGTLYLGLSPVYSSVSYESVGTSNYTSWGYQATLGFDYSFDQSFGARAYGSYSRVYGNNTSNTDTIFENVTTNDFEIGLMGTFSGWAIGGGVIPRTSTFNYVNGLTSFNNSYSGMLKFAKASLDFTTKNGNVGFSISESFIFGDVADTATLQVTEWKTLLNVFFLMSLQ